jgi:hypothetical protein
VYAYSIWRAGRLRSVNIVVKILVKIVTFQNLGSASLIHLNNWSDDLTVREPLVGSFWIGVKGEMVQLRA